MNAMRLFGIGICLASAPMCWAQHVVPVTWAEDQQLDYELQVRAESLVKGEQEVLVQEYALQFVVQRVREDGSLLATGRIRSFASQRTMGDATTSFGATLGQDGSVVTQPDDLGDDWSELAQLVVQSVFVFRVDAAGRLISLARMNPVLQAAADVQGATALLGSLQPGVLATLIEPIFLLDDAAQQDAQTWTTQELSPLGEGRTVVRTASWRVETANDDSLELRATLAMELEQQDPLPDLSPTATLDAYQGSIRSRIDSSLIERTVEDTMTMRWSVETLEALAESSSRRVLRRLVDIPRAPASTQQQEGRRESLRLPGDG